MAGPGGRIRVRSTPQSHAGEYHAHAGVGETIEIEGRELPFRPVAVLLGKGMSNLRPRLTLGA